VPLKRWWRLHDQVSSDSVNPPDWPNRYRLILPGQGHRSSSPEISISYLFLSFKFSSESTFFHYKSHMTQFRMTYRIPLGMSPYLIVFSKACHLLVELEHRAYWAIKMCNMAYDKARAERKLQQQELEELRLEAYENSNIYKQQVKQFHDCRILRKELKLIAGKLHSRWDSPFIITKVLPYGATELHDELTRSTFQSNNNNRRGGEHFPKRTGHDSRQSLSNASTNPLYIPIMPKLRMSRPNQERFDPIEASRPRRSGPGQTSLPGQS
ncbi:hypothetical protein CR513_12449, partial [Mucuna pruriens]